ncbi:unnamed protein product [Amaranthus hypochondriacus]
MKDESKVHLLNGSSTITNNNDIIVDDAHVSTPTQHAAATMAPASTVTSTILFSAFIVVLGSFSFGFVTGYTSPVEAQIMKELDLSIAEFSLFGSMNCIGGALGAIICGKITDYLGRRLTLQVFDILYLAGWFATSISQGAWMLDLGRFMLGVSMAVTGYAIPVYLAECTPKNHRGAFVILHTLVLTIGASAAFLIGLVTSWRNFALIGIIPSLVQFVGLFFIPESPRWLLLMNKNKEFEAALQRFMGASVDICQEAADIRDCAEALHQMEEVSILQLFQKKYAYSLTVGIGLSALSMLVGLSGIIAYAGSIFDSAGVSVMTGTIALAIFQLPSLGMGIILMDKCGRRPLLMTSAAGLCLGCLLAGFAYLLKGYHLLADLSPYIALSGILLYVASYPIGVGGATSVVVSEIYPLNIKGVAGSIGALVGWLTAWVVSYAFNFAMELSPSGTFFVLASICVFTLIFVAKLIPETKGKKLEEVHMLISNVRQ